MNFFNFYRIILNNKEITRIVTFQMIQKMSGPGFEIRILAQGTNALSTKLSKTIQAAVSDNRPNIFALFDYCIVFTDF